MQVTGGSDNFAAEGVLADAADWASSLFTGSLASIVATLAIAAIGFMMLSGRAPLRRAGQVILGCFILLSAQVIASGLVSLDGDFWPSTEPVPQPPRSLTYEPAIPKPQQKDPYAGAAVPASPDNL